MTQEDYKHPIAPPPELAMQWIKQLFDNSDDPVQSGYLLIKVAAQYGADQELEACVKWLEWNHSDLLSRDLRTARRPKPPSLKEQALALIDGCSDPDNDYLDDDALATIRRALEQLDG
jgi:hypothetical protein